MSVTFVCPHCGASYPRKPVLVGRAVRCTSCRNAFRLREDGIADAIEMPGAAAPVNEPPPPPTPSQRPAAASPAPRGTGAPARPLIPLSLPPGLGVAPKPKSAAPAAATFAIDEEIEVVEVATAAPAAPARAKTPPPLPRSADSGRRSAESLTSEQQEARRAMAATLATSMSAALKAETLKGEAQSAKTSAGAEGRVGKIGPAILTGEGARTASLQRAWWLITVVVIAALGGCSWLVLHRSPARLALDNYSSAVDSVRNRTDRITAIQERAWLIGLPPANIGPPAMADLSDARIGPPHVIKLAPAKPLFDQLKGMVLSGRVPMWMPRAAQQELEAQIEEGMSEKKAVATVLKLGKGAIEVRDWELRLGEAGLGDDGVAAIDLLLRGRTKSSGENAWAKRLLAGDLPAAIVLTAFSGRKGTMWVNRGPTYSPRTVEYTGTLLQFAGPGWPPEPRVLNLSTAMNPGR